jgi:hypothetical protein
LLSQQSSLFLHYAFEGAIYAQKHFSTGGGPRTLASKQIAAFMSQYIMHWEFWGGWRAEDAPILGSAGCSLGFPGMFSLRGHLTVREDDLLGTEGIKVRVHTCTCCFQKSIPAWWLSAIKAHLLQKFS